MLGGGGAQYFKHKVYSCEGRRREAMLGGSSMLSWKFFEKNCAIWCILGPIKAFITLLFFKVNFLNVAFADKSENNKKKNNLKCD